VSAARPVRIGLTGPIGCGKSTVARWLGARGAVVIDADAVARDVTAPGQPGHDAVLARFGDPVRAADGTLDRAALARIVFSDPAALRDLEAIVHPLVRPRILAAIDATAGTEAPAVAIEAIKLVEGGLAELCDEVWWVSCDEQRARLIARGLDPADADRRIGAQARMADRVRAARPHLVDVDTSGTLAVAERRVVRQWQRLIGETPSADSPDRVGGGQGEPR
jgi:dephospho-CoA kinase